MFDVSLRLHERHEASAFLFPLLLLGERERERESLRKYRTYIREQLRGYSPSVVLVEMSGLRVVYAVETERLNEFGLLLFRQCRCHDDDADYVRIGGWLGQQ